MPATQRAGILAAVLHGRAKPMTYALPYGMIS
jgi:hypothetical protein